MVIDKPFALPSTFTKRDLEIILEVNQKAIQIQSDVIEQNEDITDLLQEQKSTQSKFLNQIEDIEESQEKIEEKIDDLATNINNKMDSLNKDVFMIKAFFTAGIITIIINIISMFVKH